MDIIRPDSNIITVLTAFNESLRIERAINLATRWSKYIIVFDKTSTDNTASIATSLGAHTIKIPFSRQGHENYEEIWLKIRELADEGDWALQLTPGEIPTANLVNALTKISINQDYRKLDVISLAVRIYSFGTHIPEGPWGSSIQPRFINPKKVTVQNKIHRHITTTHDSRMISDVGNCHIFHPTHLDSNSFLKSHLDYHLAESFDATELNRTRASFEHLQRYPLNYSELHSNKDQRQRIAWHIYCLMVALKTQDDLFREKSSQELEHITHEYLAEHGLSEK